MLVRRGGDLVEVDRQRRVALDAMDRRKLLMIEEVLAALMTAGLAVNADLLHALWPLFVFPAATAALAGIDSSARNAMIPGMVGLRPLRLEGAEQRDVARAGIVAELRAFLAEHYKDEGF